MFVKQVWKKIFVISTVRLLNWYYNVSLFTKFFWNNRNRLLFFPHWYKVVKNDIFLEINLFWSKRFERKILHDFSHFINSPKLQGKIAKDARECVQECVSEFISFITSEASDRCQVILKNRILVLLFFISLYKKLIDFSLRFFRLKNEKPLTVKIFYLPCLPLDLIIM